MKRVNIPSNSTLKDLYDIAYKTLNLLDYGFSLFFDRGCSKELRSTRSVTVSASKLNHGDVVFYKQMAGSSVSYLIDNITQQIEIPLVLVAVNPKWWQLVKQQLTNASSIEESCAVDY